MKKQLLLVFILLLITIFTSCGSNKDSDNMPLPTEQNIPSTYDSTEINNFDNETQSNSTDVMTDLLILPEMVDDASESINIKIGDAEYTVILYGNDTVKALLALLPITLHMSELNGNEKYYYLSENLPTDSHRMGNIYAGDLMLYGSDCLVLFYKDFSTTYSYTKLGYIEDISELADALGSGNVQVTFDINS